ncbi:hypothetical protein OPV22_021462 [Ensete ventricosum]|uniref:C2H2-type domain-containing protein n=1 Tax=Ensete ventricosum TaxID=4639 RepID=A0AAV8QIW5_ENSVE|nr:hypothetical protein OPV22_021462 [Ensete ventricosum]
MEFWGLEIKPEETVKVDPGEDKYLHLSQASLGETKKGNENILVYVKFNNQKLVLGTLSADKCAQIQYDLVFEKEFELSHSSNNASVYLCGYKTAALEADEFPDFDESDSDADEDIQLDQKTNGKSIVKVEQAKSTAGKPKVPQSNAPASKAKPKIEELKKADKQKANKDDDEESEEDESDDDEDMVEAEDDSEDEDEVESSDEDEAPVKKAEPPNKRPAGSALKTPVSEKKAKLISPGKGESQRKGGAAKKDGHSATPLPAKQIGKTTAKNAKSKQQTPNSAGSVNCKSCGKNFNSDNALQAHTKAKHSAGK